MAAYKRLPTSAYILRHLYALPSAATLNPTIMIARTLQYLALLYLNYYLVKILQCYEGRKMGVSHPSSCRRRVVLIMLVDHLPEAGAELWSG